MTAPPPVPETEVSADLVAALLRSQIPELAGLEVDLFAEGWDNWSYRLGDRWLVRLPRRSLAAPLIENEWRWLAEIAPRLPLRIPVPRHLGRPEHGYPFPWAVYPFLSGEPIEHSSPADVAETASVIASFLAALHVPALGAPANPFRGIPLPARDPATRERIATLRGRGLSDADEVARAWEEALALPGYEGERVWLHGDLHPLNILTEEARVVAVVDWGDITAGDPAVDLSVAWILFPAETRAGFRQEYGGVSDDTWGRARGWALSLGLAMMLTPAGDPTMERIGRRTVDAVLEDRASGSGDP